MKRASSVAFSPSKWPVSERCDEGIDDKRQYVAMHIPSQHSDLKCLICMMLNQRAQNAPPSLDVRPTAQSLVRTTKSGVFGPFYIPTKLALSDICGHPECAGKPRIRKRRRETPSSIFTKPKHGAKNSPALHLVSKRFIVSVLEAEAVYANTSRARRKSVSLSACECSLRRFTRTRVELVGNPCR